MAEQATARIDGNIRYRTGDLVRMQMDYLLRLMPFAVGVAAAAAACILLLPGAHGGQAGGDILHRAVAVAALAIAAVLFSMILWSLDKLWLLVRVWLGRTSPPDVAVAIDDEAIRVSSNGELVTLEWRNVVSVRSKAQAYLLWCQDLHLVRIPKRAFPAAAIAQIDDLIARKGLLRR